MSCTGSGARVGRLAGWCSSPTTAIRPGAPAGNHFPTRSDLDRPLDDAGFAVVQRIDLTGAGDLPHSWGERIDRVESLVRTRHGHDPRFAAARAEEDQVGALLAAGRAAGLLVHATAAGRR